MPIDSEEKFVQHFLGWRYLIEVTAVLAGVLYATARYLLTNSLGEAIAMGVFVAVCLILISRLAGIRRIAEYRKVFSSPIRPWFSLVMAVLAVVLFSVGYEFNAVEAILNAFFSFLFFFAFRLVAARLMHA
jgi:hypothetical protein